MKLITKMLSLMVVLLLSSALLFGQSLSLEKKKIQPKQDMSVDTYDGVKPIANPNYVSSNVNYATSNLSRDVLYNNGPLVTHPAGGFGGADASALQTVTGPMLTSYGAGAQQTAGNSVADDFIVTGTWTLTSMKFFVYQTGSTTTSTITGVFVRIWNGAPNAGGTVVWGDLTTNLLASSTFTNDYRSIETDFLASNRPIMDVVANMSGCILTAGTYWVEYQFTGSLASGPWTPPISIWGTGLTGNAIQNTTATGWAAIVSGTAPNTYAQGLPFVIEGTTSGQPNNDLAVVSILTPSTGVLTASEPVTIRIQNLGLNSQSNFPVSYTINGGTAVNGTVAATIPSMATYDYTFTTTANLLANGIYNFHACVSLTGDQNPANNCFDKVVECVPPAYCAASTSTQDEYISNVLMGTINNSSSWQGGVADYTAIYTTIEAGASQAITVTNGNPWASDKVTVWVDWNNDFTFSVGSSEEFVLTSVGGTGASFTGTIAVPAGTSEGNHRMRIRMNYSSNPAPCGSASYGEVEDYTVNVTNPPPAPAIQVSPMVLTQMLETNQTANQVVTVTNTGTLPLTFDLAVNTAKRAIAQDTQEDIERLAKRMAADGISAKHSLGMAPAGSSTPSNYSAKVITDALRGEVAYGDNVEANNFYSLDVSSPAAITVIGSVTYAAFSGDFAPGDVNNMYIIDYNDNYLKKVNISTGAATTIASVPCPMAGTSGIWTELAIDKSNGTFYGMATDITSSNLYTINPVTGVTTLVGNMGIAGAISCTIDLSSVMYAFDIVSDNTFKVNLATGAATLLGPAGFDGNYAQGMGYDAANDVVYLAAYSTSAQLRTLNTTTGATTLIGALPGETGAFGFPYQGGPPTTKDVGVQALLSPVSAPYLGNEVVKISVKNYGTASQSNIPVSFTLDGGAAVNGTIAGPLAGGATVEYTFAGTVNLGTPGQTYVFNACTALAGDENANNNCKIANVTNVIPTYCAASTTTQDEYIANVTMGTINNSSGWQGGVADYTAIFTTIDAGASQAVTITNGTPWASDKVTIWCDWNKDFTFGVGTAEEYILTNVGGTGASFTGSVAVPAGTPTGDYRMRIRMTYSTAPVPCGSVSYGEVEDYTVKVGGTPPTAWLTADPLTGTVLAGQSMNVNVHFNSAGLANGTYNGGLVFTTNDPMHPTVEVPVTLTVGGNPDLDPPTNLQAVLTGHNVALTWDAPGGVIPGGDFMENFDAGTLPTGWLAIDNDGDGFNWVNTIPQGFGFDAHSGEGAMTSASYDNTAGPLTPDNWLISPAIQVTATSDLLWWHDAQDPLYSAEQYYVRVSTTGTALANFTQTIWSGVTPGDWAQVTVSLSAFAGQTIYIAWNHTNVTDMFWMKLDDITVTNTATRAAATPIVANVSKSGYPFKTAGLTGTQIAEKLQAYNSGAKASRALLGYNVYRDNTIIGFVTATSYADNNLPVGTYNYKVTAKYDEGESFAAGPVTVVIPPQGGVVFEDDFEAYIAGQQLACQNPTAWTTWSNLPCDATEDPYISSLHAHSGVNAAVIAQNNDLVKDFGDPYTAGSYVISFWAYIPTGKTGYFNTLQKFVPTGTSIWGIEVYFNAAGAGSINAGGTGTATFTWAPDTWFLVEHKVDMDLNHSEIWIGGNMIYSYQWSLGATGTGQNTLEANDFFGATANDQLFIDDYKLESAGPPAVGPVIGVNPASVIQYVLSGSTANSQIAITNTGDENLTYNITVEYPVAASQTEPYDAIEAQSILNARLVAEGLVSNKVDLMPGVAFEGLPVADANYVGSSVNYGSRNPSRSVLYENGPMITHPGGGYQGKDASALQSVTGPMLTTYGFGAQQTAGNSMADDFAVTGTWTLTNMKFYSYQTGSTTTSTITGIYVQIWNGAPNAGGAVVWGDLTTNRLATTTWTNIYRSIEGSLLDSNRPIMEVSANVAGCVLSAGTYWVQYTFTGSLASGPWAPPVSIWGTGETGNALQLTSTGWAAAVSGTAPLYGQGVPFIVEGTSGALPNNDLSLTGIIAPASGGGLTGTESVTIRIQNVGVNTQSNFPVTYTVNGGAAVTETVSASIASLSTYDYTFTAKANLAAIGSYAFHACVNLAGDENVANNCFDKVVEHSLPVYCDASTTTQDEYIANVTMGTINNSSGWQGGVADYTAIFTTIDAGASQDVTITNGTPWASDMVYIWVDWNKDYEFSTSTEQYMLTNVGGTGASFTGSVAVPANQAGGDYRMRIRMTYSTAPVPCGNVSYGEVEDYTVKVSGGTTPMAWLTVPSGASGTVAPGATVNVPLHFDAAGLADGTYHANLSVANNSGNAPMLDVPVTMIVGSLPTGLAVNPSSLEETHTMPAQLTTKELIVTNYGTAPITFNVVVNTSVADAQESQEEIVDSPEAIALLTARIAAEGPGTPPSLGMAPAGSSTPSNYSAKVITDALRGEVAYGDNVEANNFYSFDVSSPAGITVIGSVTYAAFSGDFAPGDVNNMYIIDYNDNYLKKVDISTGTATTIASVPCPMAGTSGIWTELAIDKNNGTFYGTATDITSSNLYTIDPVTGVTTLVGNMGIAAVISCTIDLSGVMYAFDIVSDNTFTVNLATGAGTLLGPAGFDGNYAQGMGYDAANDVVYLAAYSASAQLRTLNTTTGATTLIGALPGETGAFGFPYQGGPPAGVDVGVQTFVSPLSGPYLGNETVTIKVKNYGTSSASNIPVSYTLDGGTAHTGTLAGPIAAGATADFTFPGTVNLGTPGQIYVFVGCTALAGDENPGNNCKTASVTNVIPTYCPASTTTQDEYIANVTMGTINNSSGWQGGVADYTAINTTINAGASQAVTITNGTPWASDMVYIWVDWNKNFVFDGGVELTMLTNVGGTGASFTGSVAVPAGQAGGDYRMRIRMTYSTAPVPCGSASYGEVEDYTVKVPGGAWLTATPLTGTLNAGQSMTVTATFNSTGLPSMIDKYGSIVFNSNDPINPVITVPAHLHIGQVVEIAEIGNDVSTAIFPNPATNLVNIKSDANMGRIMIINNLGQAVYNNVADSQLVQVNTSGLKKGIYFIQIETATGMITEKLIIQ